MHPGRHLLAVRKTVKNNRNAMQWALPDTKGGSKPILIVTFGEALKDDLFKDKVGTYSSREISRLARDRKAGSLGFAEAMLLKYNAKMKKRLSLAKLYSGKRRKPDDIDLYEYAEDDEEYQQGELGY